MDKNDKIDKIDKIYKLAAQIAIKYGGQTHFIYTEKRVKELWKGKDCPSHNYVRSVTNVPRIKWYIRNKLTCTEEPWNSDFLHGLVTAGKIRWKIKTFPTLVWYGNNRLTELLKDCPFGGRLNKPSLEQTIGLRRRWVSVPSLYLPYDPATISYMAGVMASGEKIKVEGTTCIKYNIRQLPYFEQWGIPIEHKRQPYFMVSPIWPALLSPYMPDGCKSYFITPEAYRASLYAPVLWRAYLSKEFVSKGIPYLKSRRQIYYDHNCEEGVSRRLEMLRIRLGLVSLDDRIKKAVRKWAKTV